MGRWKKLLMLLMTVFLMGCSDKKEESKYTLYYVDYEQSMVESEPFSPSSEEISVMLEEMMTKSNLHDTARIQSYSIEGEILSVDLGVEYRKLKPVEEMLNRAAIVKNLVQLPGVSYVQLTVEGECLTDSRGNAIGLLNGDQFLEYSGKEITAYQHGTVKLYFADSQGKKLVEEERTLYYPSNSSIERVIVEELIKGPKSENQKAVLPSSVKIVGVSVADKIAYVNLGEKFLSEPENIQEELPIYAIVNSLVATGNVQKVQISVNGETKRVFQEHMKLDQLYEQNVELIK